MNLLRGGSGVNDSQSSDSPPEQAPIAAVPNVDLPAEEPALVPSQPPVQNLKAADTDNEPDLPVVQVVPDPRPVTPNVQASSPKRRGGWAVAGIVFLLLLTGAGIGLWWVLTQQSNEPASPVPIEIEAAAPTDLKQSGVDGSEIEADGQTNQTKINFSFTVPTNANVGSIIPEIELKPVGTAFTGEPTITGQEIEADGGDLKVSVESDTLTQGSYHWQARVKKGETASEWVVFGSDAAAAGFSIDTAPPAAPVLATIGGQAAGSSATVSSNQPALSGRSEPNSKVNITITPGDAHLTATADASGNWTATPTSQITAGQHEIVLVAVDQAGNSSSQAKVALMISAPAAAAEAPKPAAQPTQSSTPPPAASPAPTTAASDSVTTLAPTGDNTSIVSVSSLALFTLSAVGYLIYRRRYAG